MGNLGFVPSMLWTHSMRGETLSLTPLTSTQSISYNNWKKDRRVRVSLLWPHITHSDCSSLWGPWLDIYLERRALPVGSRMKTVVMAIWCYCTSYASLGNHIRWHKIRPGSLITDEEQLSDHPAEIPSEDGGLLVMSASISLTNPISLVQFLRSPYSLDRNRCLL